MLQCIGVYLDSLQYRLISKHVMVPSIRVFFLDAVVQFQEDHSPIHEPRVLQELLSWQANVELNDWPLWVPDMYYIENIWSGVNKNMRETWPDLHMRNRDALWTLTSDASDNVAFSQLYM
jgi:hypothetical protein